MFAARLNTTTNQIRTPQSSLSSLNDTLAGANSRITELEEVEGKVDATILENVDKDKKISTLTSSVARMTQDAKAEKTKVEGMKLQMKEVVAKLKAEIEVANREKADVERQMNNNAGYVEKVQVMSGELEQAKQTVGVLNRKLKEFNATKEEEMRAQEVSRARARTHTHAQSGPRSDCMCDNLGGYSSAPDFPSWVNFAHRLCIVCSPPSSPLQQMENEVKEHKSKRLNAKHELQLLLRQNDSLKGGLQTFDETIKFDVMRLLEKFRGGIEDCIRDVNVGVDSVGRKLGVSVSERGGGALGSAGIEMVGGSPSRRGGAGNETLNLLTQELGKIESGLELLKGSVEQLTVIGEGGKGGGGCFESVMDMIMGGGGGKGYEGLREEEGDRVSALDDVGVRVEPGGEGERGEFTIS